MAATRVVLLIATVVVVVNSLPQPTGRIYGGSDTESGQFPSAASVRLDSTHICGGSILDANHILTAAHCVVEKNTKPISVQRLSVRVGSSNQFAGGKIVYVSSVIVHEKYGNFKNDIAVLKLTNALLLNDKIASIAIAAAPSEQPPVGGIVTVAGWGETVSGSASYKLQVSDFTVATTTACLDAFSDSDESTICLAHARNQGSCHGDAGNGAIYNKKLVAVSNFVVGACGARYPDVFGNVAHFAQWIKNAIS